MQPGSLLAKGGEGIHCVGCHSSRFGSDCFACGKKIKGTVFSIKGNIEHYCSASCRDQEQTRKDGEEARQRAEAERRQQIAAEEEQKRKDDEIDAFLAADNERRAEEAAVAGAKAAMYKKLEAEVRDAAAALAEKQRKEAEVASAAAKAAHAAWLEEVARLEKAEWCGHTP